MSYMILLSFFYFFFVKQKTAYEMRISDWSSDVCSSDLAGRPGGHRRKAFCWPGRQAARRYSGGGRGRPHQGLRHQCGETLQVRAARQAAHPRQAQCRRSEEHTSELQSLMRISYAVFCLKKKKQKE